MTHLIIIALEVVSSLIKTNTDIESLQILVILPYTLLLQMTLPFLRHKKSATEVIKTFDKFYLFSGLKINNTKFEIAGVNVKKGFKLGLCRMEFIDLKDDVMDLKVLGIYFF